MRPKIKRAKRRKMVGNKEVGFLEMGKGSRRKKSEAGVGKSNEKMKMKYDYVPTDQGKCDYSCLLEIYKIKSVYIKS